jgi:hypothetical protein
MNLEWKPRVRVSLPRNLSNRIPSLDEGTLFVRSGSVPGADTAAASASDRDGGRARPAEHVRVHNVLNYGNVDA